MRERGASNRWAALEPARWLLLGLSIGCVVLIVVAMATNGAGDLWLDHPWLPVVMGAGVVSLGWALILWIPDTGREQAWAAGLMIVFSILIGAITLWYTLAISSVVYLQEFD